MRLISNGFTTETIEIEVPKRGQVFEACTGTPQLDLVCTPENNHGRVGLEIGATTPTRINLDAYGAREFADYFSRLADTMEKNPQWG